MKTPSKNPSTSYGGKKAKEYIFEFAMIFLAVTFGFIAENIREGISEKSQARELAQSLYVEVLSDSIEMQRKLELRRQKKEHVMYFREHVVDSNLVEVSDRFYPSLFWTFVVSSAVQFIPNDGILEQLRSSGTMRYFKDIELQNAISQMNVAIQNVRQRNNQEDDFMEDFSRPFLQKHYDFDWENELTQNGTRTGLAGVLEEPNFRGSIAPQIRNIEEFEAEDARALATHFMLLMEVTVLLDYQPYIEANHKLLEVLRKQYDIDDP